MELSTKPRTSCYNKRDWNWVLHVRKSSIEASFMVTKFVKLGATRVATGLYWDREVGLMVPTIGYWKGEKTVLTNDRGKVYDKEGQGIEVYKDGTKKDRGRKESGGAVPLGRAESEIGVVEREYYHWLVNKEKVVMMYACYWQNLTYFGKRIARKGKYEIE